MRDALTPIAARELAKIAEILSSPRPDPKDRARILRVKEESGEHLLPIQRRLWREALGEPVEAKGQADSVPSVATEVF